MERDWLPEDVLVPHLEALGRVETCQEALSTHQRPLGRGADGVDLFRVESRVEETVIEAAYFHPQLVRLHPTLLQTMIQDILYHLL